MPRDSKDKNGFWEAELTEVKRRLKLLEDKNEKEQENREKLLLKGMWLCIKIAMITTLLTFTTPKMRAALASLWGSLFQ